MADAHWILKYTNFKVRALPSINVYAERLLRRSVSRQ